MTNRSLSANTRASALRSDSVTWVGASCGRHGSYIFYKAFRFRISTDCRQAVSTSSVVVRSRSRDRRINQSDDIVTKASDDKADDVAEPSNGEFSADERILALGEFFFVQCRPEDPVCIGELQLLWHDKHSGQDLASTRLYYIPETTPAGRMPHQGKDEVLAVSEKIVTQTNDLSSWIVEPKEWNYGSSLPLVLTPPNGSGPQVPRTPLHRYSLAHSCVNMSDVKTERKALTPVNGMCSQQKFHGVNLKKEDQSDRVSNEESWNSVALDTDPQHQCTNCTHDHGKTQVLMLSLTAYCRHMAIMKRIEGTEQKWLSRPGAAQLLATLGVYTSDNPRTRLVFCRGTFDYPQLFEHDLICEELAPVFKGRPRKKTKKPNSLPAAKTQVRKASALVGIRTGARSSENLNPLLVKLDRDDLSSTRRSSGRRRSKRKSPQKTPYENIFSPVIAKSAKRLRRGSTRTPTPVTATSREHPDPTSKSEPTSPAEDQGVNVGSNSIADGSEATSAAKSNSLSKRKKRRPGYRTTALSIAIKNSLVENHKVKDPEASPRSDKEEVSKFPLERSNSLESSSSTSSSGSSRSSSLPSEHPVNSFKASSPTESLSSASNSNDPYGQLSPSPLDFSAIMSVGDDQSIKELDLSTSEENMYLRGLSDGNLPENKSAFLDILHQFMQRRNTPIGRIPSLGFKKLDLWAFFKLSQEFGGYEMITAKRLWKHVYDRMGGNPSCTSAATCTRKHFEKLLLPLEKYLRKTLRKKEMESATTKPETEEPPKTNTHETQPGHSPLNGRTTFDGDAYFHNVAKINPPVSIPDIPKPTSTPELNSDLNSESITSPASEAASISSTHITISTNPIVHRSAAIITAAPSIMNLESLADSVIRTELLANKQTKPEESTESLIKSVRSKATNQKLLQNHDVIDLTGPHADKFSSNSPGPCQPVMHQRFVQPTQSLPKHPIAVPSTMSRPPALSVFTHCPRLSMAPPPYVPTKASTPKLDTLDQSTTRSSSESSHPCRDKVSDQSDRFLSQKRPLSVDKDHRNLSVSPISPKRLRPVSLLTTPSPSNRSYDIRNLVSIPPDEATSRFQSKESVHGEVRVHSGPEAQPPPLISGGKWDVGVKKVFEPRPLPPKQFDYSYSLKEQLSRDVDRERRAAADRQPVCTERRNSQMTSHSIARSREEAQVLSASQRRSSPPTRVSHSSERGPTKARERYYRPSGMLETHREAVKRQQNNSAPNGVVKQEPLSDRRHHDERSSLRPLDDVIIGGHKSRSPPIKDRLTASRSPTMMLQRPSEPEERKPFSSSFSVDSLTSSSNNKPTLPNGPRPQIFKEQRDARNPHPLSTIDSKSHSTHPSYPNHRQEPYRPQTDKDIYRVALPGNASLPLRKEEVTQKHDKPRWGGGKDPHSRFGRVQNPTTKSSISAPEKPPNGRPGRGSMEVPSSLSSHNRPFVQQDCHPAVLDPFMLQRMKNTSSTLPPGSASAPGLSLPPGSVQDLQEVLFRQYLAESPFHLNHHQEQQAAAARSLAMINNSNPMLGADPAAMTNALHMFNVAQIASMQHLRQYQEAAAVNNASNKHAITPELLNAHARSNGSQLEYRNPGLLMGSPQLPQNITPEAAAAAFAYAYARR